MLLLTALRRCGLTLALTADGRLAVTGRLTDEMAEDIRAHRAELVEALRREMSPHDEALALLARIDTLDEKELDRLVVLGVGYFDVDALESLNRALAKRAGLDADEIRAAADAFDQPKDPPRL